jgi:hypothetical protein
VYSVGRMATQLNVTFCDRSRSWLAREEPPDMDASLVVDVATAVAPERSFCFFNAVYELVRQMIARYFAFGHEMPGRRQILARAEAV